MLRRPPTILTLTAEDIASYEDRKQRGEAATASSPPSTGLMSDQQHPAKLYGDGGGAASQAGPIEDHGSNNINSNNNSPLAAQMRRIAHGRGGSHQLYGRNMAAEAAEEDSEDDAEADQLQQQQPGRHPNDNDGDEEMADYDASAPRLPRPTTATSTATTTIASASASIPDPPAVTPPSNQTHIPQAPTRPGPGAGAAARTTAPAAATSTTRRRGQQQSTRTVGTRAAAAVATEHVPEGRVTRSREERIGVSGGASTGVGTRRTAR